MKKSIIIAITIIVAMEIGVFIGAGVTRQAYKQAGNMHYAIASQPENNSQSDVTSQPDGNPQPGIESQPGSTQTGTGTWTKVDSNNQSLQNSSQNISNSQTTSISQSLNSSLTTRPTNATALKVENGKLVNMNGQQVVLRGISTHGINVYPEYVNYDSFKFMKEQWNINVVRLAMYTCGEDNGYAVSSNEVKEKLKTTIRNGVKYATDLDMYVIIDWHILSDGNPNIYKDQAIDFFNQMSAEFKDHDNIIYEICNEPNGNIDWNDMLNYCNVVIPTIRNNDNNAVIIVGTPDWCQRIDMAQAAPMGYPNILYSVHFYADTHREDLRKRTENAINAGIPVFISEFGICDASGNGNINYDEASKWLDLMNKYGLSACIWNLSNKNESAALIRSESAKTTGWTDSDLSSQGIWARDIFLHQ